jgi:amino acid transporter
MSVSEKVFLRKASGLVREISLIDVLFYNVAQVGAGIGIAYIVLLLPAFYAGSDMALSSAICLAGTLFTCLVYALLSIAMPRSGGDYVFNSRIIHPAIGFTLNWNFVIWEIFYVGWSAGAFAFLGLSALFTFMGLLTGNPSLMDYATFVSYPTGFFIIGTIILIIFALLLIVGTKKYFIVTNAMMIVSLISIFSCIILTALSSQEYFILRFNSFAKAYTTSPNPYNAVIEAAAQTGGPIGVNFDWEMTLRSIVWPAMYLLFSGLSSIFAGEIKEAKKNQLYGTIGSVLLSGFLLISLGFLAAKTFGYDFLAAVGWNYYNNPSALPLPTGITPWYSLFVSMLTDNALLITIILVGFAFWAVYWTGVCALYATRSMLAWAFDRLTPAKIGHVSPRFRTPTVATIVTFIIAEIFLALYAFTPYFAVLSGFLGLTLTFIVTSIAAIIFPFTKKSIYEKSPVNYRVGKIPLISICGVISLIFTVYTEYLLIIDDIAGANTLVNICLVSGLLIFGLIYFYLMRHYRKKQGIDIDLAYKEIPIE